MVLLILSLFLADIENVGPRQYWRTAGELYDDCKAQNPLCVGYLWGVDDFLFGVYCPRGPVTGADLWEAFREFVDETERARELPAHIAYVSAVSEKWPCPPPRVKSKKRGKKARKA